MQSNTQKLGPPLDLKKCSISFGGLKAVSDVTLTVKPLEILGLIGPNGAGKTTVFNLVTGVYKPDSGTIAIGDTPLIGTPPFMIAKLGVARTFQNIRLFGDLSVLQNVLISFHMRVPYNYVDLLLKNRRYKKAEAELKEQALSLLQIFGLRNRAHDIASSLSYGDQRRLEIARALATRPRILLLDEPAAGLNSQEKVELMKLVPKLRSQFQIGILLIEHDMKLVMGVCERIVVLDHGEIIAEGTPKEIQANRRVIEAYLGVE